MIKKYLLLILFAACFLVSFSSLPAHFPASPIQIEAFADKYRPLILEQMEKQKIAGFSIALVDSDDVLWSEGFGCTDWSCTSAVTQDTPFGIQSMTKSMTAAAVLFAVQEGVLELDTPISAYLPDFSVHSLFDDRPQDVITLRMLLSHTAGFTHEAPVGNNFDLEPGDWETHIASISETWLKYPVGRGWEYSNLGIDLAGYILEQAAGIPFQQYVQTRLFEPLGMSGTTLDLAQIGAMPQRALGQSPLFRNMPLVAMMPAGGAYSSAADMARYVQFHINRGNFQGQQVLDANLAALMYAPQFRASANNQYGLGLGVTQGRYGSLKVSHGGAGFGFMSMMAWYPDLQLGIVWLSNSAEHDLQNWLADAILDDVINAAQDVYSTRSLEHPSNAPVIPTDPPVLNSSAIAGTIRELAQETDQDARTRWSAYAGIYGIPVWGRITEIVKISAGDQLSYDGELLFEVEPGLFFSAKGEALDFRGSAPTWRNLELVRIDHILLALKISLGVCAIAFLSALPWAVIGAISGARRRRREPPNAEAPFAWVWGATRIVLVLAAILGLLSLAIMTQFPHLLFGGIPFPHRGLIPLNLIGFSIPYAAAGMSVLAALGVGFAYFANLERGWMRIWAVVIVAALFLASLLILF